MLVNIHIPFSQAARARRFSETGDASDGRVYVADTNELDETQRAHLLRMMARPGEDALPVFGNPHGELPSSVWISTYEPAPNIARVIRRVRDLDFSNLGDVHLLDAISDGAPKEKIIRLALAGDIERWNVALTLTRIRLAVLVSSWKRETSELIQRLHVLEDPFAVAQAKHYKAEAPQWLDEVVRSGDTTVLNLWRQLTDAFQEARVRLWL